MNRGVLVGAAIAVAALALGTVMLMRSETAADATRPVPVAPVVSAPAATMGAPAAGTGVGAAAGSVAGSASSIASTLPWNTPGSERPAAIAPGTPSVSAGRPGAPTLEEIQARLQALSSSKQPTVREVDAVLADLQKNQGSAVVAGVDLQAVRDNLARTERIQQLALEMQALAAAPTADTPAQLQSRVVEMQRLQAGMTTNVAAPTGAAR